MYGQEIGCGCSVFGECECVRAGCVCVFVDDGEARCWGSLRLALDERQGK